MATLLNLAMEVLVVDDEPKKKTIVRNTLERASLSVCWCRNWKETENLLQERVNKGEALPDVVLVDMYFGEKHCILGSNPGIEGLLIIEKLAKTFEAYGLKLPPIVGFTGTQRYMDPEAIIEYGANDFITDAEYKRPNHFTRRLIRSVMEVQFENSFNRPKEKNIQEIEEGIVYKALRNRNNDLKQAAILLRWPESEVKKVTQRLENKGVL